MLSQLRPGLWRWVARHPDATEDPTPESTADWPPEVGSVAYAAADALVFVDPLVAEGDSELWSALDGLVEAHGRRVAVLTTVPWHRRSRQAFVDRYGASTSRARRTLPAGVETITIQGAGETMVWLPQAQALVPGDRMLGDGRGGLRLCPASWLGYLRSGVDLPELADALRPLLELPVELVLATHGEPVLSGGREAIARAIDRAPT